MIACIPGVLSAREVETLLAALARGEFVDGKLSAGIHAAAQKQNLQLKRSEAGSMPIEKLVADAIARNAEFGRVTLPKGMAPVLFNRYEPGMTYGPHVDNPIMGPLRTDLSMTVFLSDPASYDGGELCLQTDLGVEEIKLVAGDAVVYPATNLHWVKPVTRGVRLAAITWVQSLVRDHTMRQVLRDISAVTHVLVERDPQAPEAQQLIRAQAALLRLIVDA